MAGGRIDDRRREAVEQDLRARQAVGDSAEFIELQIGGNQRAECGAKDCHDFARGNGSIQETRAVDDRDERGQLLGHRDHESDRDGRAGVWLDDHGSGVIACRESAGVDARGQRRGREACRGKNSQPVVSIQRGCRRGEMDRSCAACEHDLFLRYGRVLLAGGGDLTHGERAGALKNHGGRGGDCQRYVHNYRAVGGERADDNRAGIRARFQRRVIRDANREATGRCSGGGAFRNQPASTGVGVDCYRVIESAGVRANSDGLIRGARPIRSGGER